MPVVIRLAVTFPDSIDIHEQDTGTLTRCNYAATTSAPTALRLQPHTNGIMTYVHTGLIAKVRRHASSQHRSPTARLFTAPHTARGRVSATSAALHAAAIAAAAETPAASRPGACCRRAAG